jgi:heme oxygenase
VRKYIETKVSHTYTADNLDKLLEQAQHQRVTLISDTAGMGKSTVLTHLSKKVNQKFPAKWVVNIDLHDLTDALKPLKQEQIDKEKAIEFVSQTLLKLEPGLEVELFKQCCEQKQKVRKILMLGRF